MDTRYTVRTGPGGTPMYLIRVQDWGAAGVDIYHVPSGDWVPAPDPVATLQLVEPGWDSDYAPVLPADLPAVIAALRAANGAAGSP